MNQRNIFSILEIEQTYDKKEIKKAYAKLVKKYHPEEYPEKWKEIHDAYEAAVKIAEYGGQDIYAFSMADNEKLLTFEVQSGKMEKPPEPIIKVEKTENLRKSPEESDELDSLFDNINTLSKEQQEQDREAFEKELQEVMGSFKKISDKKKLDRKEWEDFFSKKTRLPYICNREFLRMLGECLSDRKIDARMYQFLMEQLEVIKTYCTDRNIVLQTISVLDPVKYVEIKVSGAYSRGKGGGLAGRFRAVADVCKKIAIAILVIAIIIIRLNIGHMGQSQKETEVLKFQEIAENKRTELVTYYDNLAYPDIRGVPTRPPQIGDTKEQMIVCLGEPDEVQISEEYPDREEAVYLPGDSGIRIVIILDDGIITDIQAEYVAE